MVTKKPSFWLNDKELKTPEHDEIVIWSMDHAPEIIDAFGTYTPYKTQFYDPWDSIFGDYPGNNCYEFDWEKEKLLLNLPEIEEWRREIQGEINKLEGSYFNVEKDEWEDSFYESKFKKKINKLEFINNLKKLKHIIEDSFQKFKIIKQSVYLIDNIQAEQKIGYGWVDLIFTILPNPRQSVYFGELFKNHTKKRIVLEIKPKVKSFGETLRQINFYREYLMEDDIFILVTKTKELNDLFESQGVYVYNYEPKQKELLWK